MNWSYNQVTEYTIVQQITEAFLNLFYVVFTIINLHQHQKH